MAPLGFEIGTATREEVEAKISEKARWARPVIYACNKAIEVQYGEALKLDVPGLSSVHFCFDKDDKLEKVTMQLGTAVAEQVLASMSAKYQTISKEEIPDKDGKPQLCNVIFKQRDSYIRYRACASVLHPKIILNYVNKDTFESQEAEQAAVKAQMEGANVNRAKKEQDRFTRSF